MKGILDDKGFHCNYQQTSFIKQNEQGRRKLFSIGPAGYGGGSRNLRAGGGHPPAQQGVKLYKKATARRPLK